MTHSTRARNPESTIGVTDLVIDLRSAREEANQFVQVQMPGDDKHSSMAGQVEGGSRLEHRLRKASTA